MKHVIYIKPGAAGGDGTKNEPIGNIFEAQKKVRELLAAPDTESVTVKIAPGEYNIVSPIEFDSSDSGKPGSPVVWECEGGRALIHASIAVGKGQITRVLPDDQLYSRLPCPEKTLQFDLGKLGVAHEVYSEGCHGFGMAYSGKNPMRDGSDIELFVDGVPFIRARYPNDGFVEVERSSDRESAVFGYSDPRPESWASLEGVRLHGYFYFDWADASVALGELDKENKTITLAEMPHYGIKTASAITITISLKSLICPVSGTLTLQLDARIFYRLKTLARYVLQLQNTGCYGQTARRILFSVTLHSAILEPTR